MGSGTVVTPAVKWAQSVNSTFIEVKLASRNDLPACSDVHNYEVELDEEGRTLNVSAICKNDDVL